MTRDEFMKELAYLLQDIQDEDKDDAVQYYTDYFEEEMCIRDSPKCHQDSCQNAQDCRGQTQQTAANTKEHGKGHNDEHSP